ncbi:MAG: thioredoxin family protein [Caldilinea sp.]
MNSGDPILAEDKLLAFAQCLTFRDYSQWLGGERNLLLARRYTESRRTPAAQAAVNSYSESLAVLALLTDDDPDTVAVLPVLARLFDASPRLQLRILSESLDLAPLATLWPELDVAAALEEWDLPQFLIFDEEWELQAQWGPRPRQAEQQLSAWLQQYPHYEALADDESPAAQAQFADLTVKLTQEMRSWYNSTLSAACQQEVCELLATLLPIEESADTEVASGG